jgi:hypothetical protein
MRTVHAAGCRTSSHSPGALALALRGRLQSCVSFFPARRAGARLYADDAHLNYASFPPETAGFIATVAVDPYATGKCEFSAVQLDR